VVARSIVVALVAVAGAACTPKDVDPIRVTYDGPAGAALSTLARDCVPYGVSASEPLAKASDLKCTSADAEVAIHLDKSRKVRGVHIKLVSASSEEAHARLDAALTPLLDQHHRANVLTHLDDPVPGGINPIPQLELEGRLYQIASEPADGDRRRYIIRIRID
jgi:hypothetical protein